MSNLNKYTISEALELIRNKKGAGISKNTNIKIWIDIKSSITRTESILVLLKGVEMSLSPNMKTEIITELQNNPDWEK